jgi:seryl-tRNA synthetase
MLDLVYIRENPEAVKQAVANKNEKADVDAIMALDKDRRALLTQVEEARSKRNAASKEIGRIKQSGGDASDILKQMQVLADEMKAGEARLSELDKELEGLLLTIPNLPHESVPVGRDESDNQQINEWGKAPSFDFEPKNHWDIGENLDILNFEQAAKVAGARFVIYRGAGARLERALINFMLDLHTTKHGYTEIMAPYLANRDSMIGCGQIPKLENDMFKVEEVGYFLIPTGEVPLTNLHREEMLTAEDLPKYYVGYTACFRKEAGSHGKDTRGLIRQHQFNKVEMVKLCKPEDSWDEHKKLLANAEAVLQALGLHYRVMVLATGDLSFAGSKCYDLEVWLPGQNRYREISSCSNFTDFQARRAKIRFKRDKKSKPEFVHTLNGSGLAVGRTLVAILENYQQADGSVKVPDVLVPYMNGQEIIQA